MGKTTGIQWTDSTWNPIRGCSRVSEGCRNCYAEKVAGRFSGPGLAYHGLATFKGGEARWTGEVRLIERHLRDPLSWKAPRKIFVNSMSDLFHPGVSDEWLAEIFDVMARAPQHTYQILTKRPDRMLDALKAASAPEVVASFAQTYGQPWPPPNWIFGVSIEDQATATYRLPILAKCNCAQTMVSYEPAIGPVEFGLALPKQEQRCSIDWIICGGESGHGARPMHPEWVRSVRRFCSDYQIPFFFKQWGEFLPGDQENSHLQFDSNRAGIFDRLGKKATGAMLDGKEWKEFPRC
jgi:protein gp37